MRSPSPVMAMLLCGWLWWPSFAAGQIVEVPTFELGPPLEGHLQDVDVAVATDGSIVFIWGEYDLGGPDKNDHAVTHWWSPLGIPIAPPQVADTDGHVHNPSLSSDTRGGYVAAWLWVKNGQAYLPFGRRLTNAGVGQLGSVDFDADPERLTRSAAPWPIAVGLPSGSVYLWDYGGLWARMFDPLGQPRGDPFLITQEPVLHASPYERDAEVLPDGGFVAVWRDLFNHEVPSWGRIMGPDGAPRGDQFGISSVFQVRRVAVSPSGRIAVVGVSGGAEGSRIWGLRLDPNGGSLGDPFLVHQDEPGTYLRPEIEFDHFDNMLVTWAAFRTDAGLQVKPPFGRAFSADGMAQGPAFALSDEAGVQIRTVRLLPNIYGGSGVVNVWYAHGRAFGNIVSVCGESSATCGDGVVFGACEQCDDGPANSDTEPDACRTSCTSASCGDGVVDTGEECDDGNRAACDGCDQVCRSEVGGTCGDGIVLGSCGEQCDHGNVVAGDGCSALCRLERVGGGSTRRACYGDWRVDNPTNRPFLDKRGRVSRKQYCVDNDPLCDHDGGVTGSCTFHVGVCANATDLPDCFSSSLTSFELARPSAQKAATDPMDGEARANVLAAVAPLIGSSERDVCSDLFDVRVPLRGKPSSLRKGKKVLFMRAHSSSGSDKNSLKLTCLTEPEPASFSEVWDEVLQPHCVFCHKPEESCCNFLDFTTRSTSWLSLQGAGQGACAGSPRVVAGDPEQSLLYQKVARPHGQVCGARMPAQLHFPEDFESCTGKQCLAPDEIELIRQWILQGARNS